MSLVDRIQGDIDRIFFRETEFARRHDWNGHEIVCIVDGDTSLAHKNQNTLSIEWDVGEADLVVRVPTNQFEKAGIPRPQPSSGVMFDERMCRIENVKDNEGELIILLRDQEARGVI